MSNPSVLGVIAYEVESAFSESSSSFSTRLGTVSAVDVSGLTQDRIDIERTSQYRNANAHHIRGPLGGSVSISLPLTGHGSTCAGSISATDVATLLGYCVGSSAATAVGGTVNTPTDADTFTVTSVTAAAGGLMRVGAPGDSRGGGQFTVANDLSDWDVALPAAPNAADVVYASEWVYPDSAPGASPSTLRMQLGTANQRYNCHGMVCTGVEVSSLNPGEVPMLKLDFAVSRWAEENASTWPSTDSVQTFSPSPAAAGSLFYNTVVAGTPTATRQTIDYRDFALTINMEAGLKPGPGSATGNAHEMYVGAYQNKCMANFSFSIDAEASGTTTFPDIYGTDENSLNYYHFLLSLSTEDGRAVGFYFPRCTPTSPRPTQSAVDGYNRQTIAWECQTNTTDTASELTLSNWRLGMG